MCGNWMGFFEWCSVFRWFSQMYSLALLVHIARLLCFSCNVFQFARFFRKDKRSCLISIRWFVSVKIMRIWAAIKCRLCSMRKTLSYFECCFNAIHVLSCDLCMYAYSYIRYDLHRRLCDTNNFKWTRLLWVWDHT